MLNITHINKLRNAGFNNNQIDTILYILNVAKLQDLDNEYRLIEQRQIELTKKIVEIKKQISFFE
jgi:DNA-binding transcriptional MerR regulator